LDDKIIGNLIVARFGKEEGYLNRIGVAKEHQGKGFGSKLMEYAIDWFRQEGGIKTVHLHADLNEAAQGMYRKHGFTKIGTTWHYFVPFDSLEPIQKYTCHEIQDDEIDSVGSRFPSIPPETIRRFLTNEKQHVLTLKDENENIAGVCRFTPGFPGCFPFEITNIDCFDDFVFGIKEFSIPEYDYCRVTFTDIPELADLCEKRDYRIHHILYKMSLEL
jgi:predicted GNAT family acetyltransferase